VLRTEGGEDYQPIVTASLPLDADSRGPHAVNRALTAPSQIRRVPELDGTPDAGDDERASWADWTDRSRRRRAILELVLRAAGLVAVGVLALVLAAIARTALG
jgi:hypothetical protein